MQISNQDRRLTYQNALELCKKYGIDAAGANPAYGYLRLETPVQSGQTQYQFPVLQNQTYNGYNQSPTEQRLALQDNFVVGSKFFGMVWYDTLLNRPASKLLTYHGFYNVPRGYSFGVNRQQYLPAWSPSVKGLQNEFWISGWMKYSMNYGVIVPRYDCLQHYYVPRQQSTFQTQLVANAGVIDPAADEGYQTTMEEADGLSDGFMPMEPNIVLSGGKNTEINYYLPFPMSFADLGWTDADVDNGTLQPRLVCIYRGILLQNTTNVK